VGRLLTKLPFWLLILVIIVYALFPFYWALRSAFTPDKDLFTTPIQYFPSHPTWAHFRAALSSNFFQHALVNSTIVAGAVTLISLAIGALAVPLGRYGVYAAIGAAIVMCALMPSVSNSYADDHARRFPQGLDYIVDTSPSNASSRGEWEHAAHESIVGMAEWTLVLVGLALAAALFVHVRGRRGAPVPPPPAVAGVGETSPVVGPDPS
jgi:hypothetical protein